MKFLDLFAGIGGFRLGMEQAGHECIGHVEKDKFARKSYQAIHSPKETEFDGEDITKITDEQWRTLRGTVDCICAGFPCQAFSIAGKRRGFEDTRGTMFFEVARAAKQIQPRYLLLENVKGLLSHNNGQTFAVILSTLDELGYDAEWQVLNSKNFGVPQNRERVFVIGHLRDSEKRCVFPIEGTTTGVFKGFQADTSGRGRHSYQDRAFEVTGIVGCLPNARAETKLMTYDQDGNFHILTGLERMRCQGFPDDMSKRAIEAVGEKKVAEQAGNSVTVNVIREIGRRME